MEETNWNELAKIVEESPILCDIMEWAAQYAAPPESMTFPVEESSDDEMAAFLFWYSSRKRYCMNISGNAYMWLKGEHLHIGFISPEDK